MSTSRSGRERELRIAKRLEEFGWELVMHAAASKGPADLVMAHERHGVALIQVGTAGKALGPEQRERLLHAAELCAGLPLLATTVPSVGFRLRLVLMTPSSSWPDFDPIEGIDVMRPGAIW